MWKRNLKSMLAVLLLGVAGILYSCGRPPEEAGLLLQQEAGIPEEDANAPIEGANAPKEGLDASKKGVNSSKEGAYAPKEGADAGDTAYPSEGTAQKAVLYVQICGQVLHPGVYAMEEGSRVFQVVEEAGGLTGTAASEYLNLAEVIRDGMKIVVPSQSEVEASEVHGLSGLIGAVETSPEGTPKVNLNTATKEELMALKGIGEAKAADIIRYRTEQGPFRRIEDIMGIPGIKDAAFEKIKENITV